MPLFKKKVDRKKFSETTVGKFLKEKGPHILEAVGDRFPAIGLITDLITKDDKLSPEDKVTALEMAKIELSFEQNITDRWKSDMDSDSVLSKNARPIVLLYSWFLLTLVIVLSFFKVNIPPAYTTMVEVLCGMVNVAYFGSRGIEKIQTIRSR